jgi:ABC-2 type transport system permease protein
MKYRPLLNELVIRDIKVRYRHSVLGVFWTVLNPLLMMVVMSIVFSKLFGNTIENFAIYYLSGYIFYSFLNESTTQALFSVVNNGALAKKVYIPKYLFPLSKIVSALVNLLFSFCALVIVMMLTGTKFYWTILLSIVPALYLAAFCCGVGLILSTLNVFFRDIGHLYNIIMLVWMYLTPLFYPETLLIDNGMPYLLYLNPLYHNVAYFRMLILEGTVPGMMHNLVCILPGLVLLVVGIAVFKKHQDTFILYI